MEAKQAADLEVLTGPEACIQAQADPLPGSERQRKARRGALGARMRRVNAKQKGAHSHYDLAGAGLLPQKSPRTASAGRRVQPEPLQAVWGAEDPRRSLLNLHFFISLIHLEHGVQLDLQGKHRLGACSSSQFEHQNSRQLQRYVGTAAKRVKNM